MSEIDAIMFNILREIGQTHCSINALPAIFPAFRAMQLHINTSGARIHRTRECEQFNLNQLIAYDYDTHKKRHAQMNGRQKYTDNLSHFHGNGCAVHYRAQ